MRELTIEATPENVDKANKPSNIFIKKYYPFFWEVHLNKYKEQACCRHAGGKVGQNL